MASDQVSVISVELFWEAWSVGELPGLVSEQTGADAPPELEESEELVVLELPPPVPPQLVLFIVAFIEA